MKRVLILIAVIVLIFTANVFGQTQHKKQVHHNLPEVNDEVLVNFRKKNGNHKTSKRRKSIKTVWDDTDIVYRQNRKNKSRKIRRKKK